MIKKSIDPEAIFKDKKPLKFNSTPQRQQQTERVYRAAVKSLLLELLRVMNPQDLLQHATMSYENLVVYARDWLDTEAQTVTYFGEGRAPLDPKPPLGQSSSQLSVESEGGLSLDE